MAAPGGAPLLAVATNPAIDRVARIDGPASGVVRAREALETPGGKAIHVAMVAAQLGAEAAVLTTAGGRDGELLLDLLAAEPLPAHPVRVDAETRGTYTVVGAGGDLLEVHEPSGALGGEECDRLVAELERLAPRRPIVAVCGSLPPGTDPDLHARLLGAARAAGCFAILDCSTPAALEPALAAGPDLVAPNLGEARRLLGSGRDGDPDDAELARLSAALIERGAGAAWISLGAAGSVLARPGGLLRLRAPVPARIVNAVGCGDALLGGLVAGLSAGSTLERAAALGVAAATDKLGRLHPGRIGRERVLALRHEVETESLRDEVGAG